MIDCNFSKLGIIKPITTVLSKYEYEYPSPIQSQALPIVLAGDDLLGIAQTGTGKTAAFLLPLLQLLYTNKTKSISKTTRTLILAPTRELALQIAEKCKLYGVHLGLRQTSIYGGVKQQSQVNAMRQGVDLLIATPGRLLDLMKQGHINLERTQYVVLDEADTMLDMGFIHDIRNIMKQLPKKRQTLLFSATMPDAIESLADTLLTDPKKISITPKEVAVERIKQSVMKIGRKDKRKLLITILTQESFFRTIVFCRTKHGADRVVRELKSASISAYAIHGNKTQGNRQRALEGFRKGKVQVLVATDIAARGIDVDSVSHVINLDLPNIPENYVHRIGRTARAGADGDAISFCDETEGKYLKAIEKLIKFKISVVPTPELIEVVPAAKPLPEKTKQVDTQKEKHTKVKKEPSSNSQPTRRKRRRRKKKPTSSVNTENRSPSLSSSLPAVAPATSSRAMSTSVSSSGKTRKRRGKRIRKQGGSDASNVS